MTNRFLIRSFLLLIVLSGLTGCGWNPLGFLSKDKGDKPAELVDFKEEVKLHRLWSAKIGSGQGEEYNRLKPAIAGDVIYAAGNNGVVTALQRSNGNRLWRVKLHNDITGGVGVGGDLVLVGSQNSEVIALNAENGATVWEAGVSSEVLSAPAGNGDVVVVQSIDGRLTCLDAKTGRQRWIYENTVPALTLRGTSSPLILGNFVIAAFGNGTVESIALDNGTLRWEQRVAIPTGRSEIDRMVDIDGDLFVNDAGLLLAPSYQGYLAVIDVVTGQTRWRVKESSAQGAASGFGNIYISDEKGHIKAYKTGQDEPVWSNDQLDLRKVTGPASFSNYVAVADFQGYVHLLSQVDGRFVGRIKVDSDGVRSHLLASDNILYVYGNGGKLVALGVE